MNFSPGPSKLFPSIPKHIHEALDVGICSMSHRSSAFSDIVEETGRSLRQILGVPDDFHLFFVSSATEAMERLVQNLVEKRSLHLVNGAFSRRFFMVSQELGKEAHSREVPEGACVLNLDPMDGVELLAVTHNESSAGVSIPDAQFKVLREAFPEALIAVDVVSSVPYVNIDYTLVDAAFFSVQKGFGLPSGLGVMIVGPRCIAKAQELSSRGIAIGSYHSFPELKYYAEKFQTPETPNQLAIYLLGKVAAELSQKGLEAIRRETEEKANCLYNHFSQHSLHQPFVENESWRSKTILVIGGAGLKDNLEKKGIIVGAGYGENKHSQIRIANFPAHTLEEVHALIAAC